MLRPVPGNRLHSEGSFYYYSKSEVDNLSPKFCTDDDRASLGGQGSRERKPMFLEHLLCARTVHI